MKPFLRITLFVFPSVLGGMIIGHVGANSCWERDMEQYLETSHDVRRLMDDLESEAHLMRLDSVVRDAIESESAEVGMWAVEALIAATENTIERRSKDASYESIWSNARYALAKYYLWLAMLSSVNEKKACYDHSVRRMVEIENEIRPGKQFTRSVIEGSVSKWVELYKKGFSDFSDEVFLEFPCRKRFVE